MSLKLVAVALTLAFVLLCPASSLPHHIDNVDPPEVTEPTEGIPNEAPPPELPVVKRSVRSAFNVQERLLSRKDAGVEISLIEHKALISRRRKRSVFIDENKRWPNVIPYKIDASYNSGIVGRLRSVLKFIEDHLCVDFVEVSDFNPVDFDGLTTYLVFRTPGYCQADSGKGKSTDSGPRYVDTCTNWDTILHETFHALGVVHEQQNPDSTKFISSLASNIPKNMYYNFEPMSDVEVMSGPFDPSSVMLYGEMDFSENGRPVIDPLRDDMYTVNFHKNNFRTQFLELNMAYNCVEYECDNNPTDCGLGYYAKEEGVCKCVCPQGFSSDSNCRDLVGTNAPATAPEWPDAPLIMYSAKARSCPEGLDVGLIRVPGNVIPYADTSFKDGASMTIWICSKASSTNSLAALPPGQYCVIKPINVACEDPFSEGTYTIAGKGPITSNVTNGDITITTSPDKVSIKYCCRQDRNLAHSMDLPNTADLRMINYKSTTCPGINGMSSRKGKTVLYGGGSTKSGSYPAVGTYSGYTFFYHCYYYTPTYDCNMNIMLDASNRDKTVPTPVLSDGKREPNRRCLYYFNIPKHSKISVTFNSFELETDDHFSVRRYHPLVNPLILTSSNFRKHIVSAEDFLFMEYWSSSSNSAKTGVSFTVHLTTPEQMCYNVSEKGADYRGNKWVSEQRDACVPWSEAANCPDFPFKGLNLFHVTAHGNKCRNPGGNMEEPWCYTYVRDRTCRKRYCDVCNLMNQEDLFDNCATLIANEPNFCTSSLQRLACSSECGILTQPPAPTSSDCPQGWHAYKDRCFTFVGDAKTQKDAEDHCNSDGATLFKVRHVADVGLLLDFQGDATDPQLRTDFWINGRYNTLYNEFRSLGDNQKLRHEDMASTAVTNDPSKTNLYLRSLVSSEPGKMDTALDAHMAIFVCERARLVTYGPPPIPQDSEATQPLKSEYKPGEQVTFQCTKTGYAPTQATTLLDSEGWTVLRSVCEPCENGWTLYEDNQRCYKWFHMAWTQPNAQAHCVSLGGTIFKIKDAKDLANIRNIKLGGTHWASKYHNWLNIKRVNGIYVTLDDETEVTYTNFLSSTVHDNPSKDRVYLIGEGNSNRGFYTTHEKYFGKRFFCERPLSSPNAVADGSTEQCLDVLSFLPGFATSEETKDLACSSCPESVGRCSYTATDCNSGWNRYLDRCYRHFSGFARTLEVAESTCNSNMGTLFKIKSQADHTVIVDYKKSSTESRTKNDNNWLNAKRDSDGKWYTLDDHSLVTYFNWSNAVGDPATATGDGIVLIGSDKDEAGKYTIDDSSQGHRFICQYTSEQNKPKCHSMTGVGSHSTSLFVYKGDYLTFECDDGLYYEKGDKHRACVGDNSLAGEEYVCSTDPRSVSLNEREIIPRNKFLSLHTAYVFNVPAMTIPLAGEVTEWYLYASVGGDVTFLVYRFDATTNTFALVGQNTLTVPVVHHEWSISVPEADRISVQAGDFLGFFSANAKIAANNCDSSSVKMSVVQKKTGVTLADLTPPPVYTSQCIIPSVGARVQG